jgi:hypothetical protein
MFHVDMAYKSMNQHGEELCGDKVELLNTNDSHIMILANGMGSGVRANILASMTSKILATMILNGETIDECMSTVLSTLPISSESNEAYATFTVLQVNDNGKAYLVEFDNPDTICIRNGKPFTLPKTERMIEDKLIRECHFEVQNGDTYAVVSEGCFVSELDKSSNWDLEDAVEFVQDCLEETHASKRLANQIVQESCDYYRGECENDVTAAVMRIRNYHKVKFMTGPPKFKENDEAAVADLMEGHAFRIVSGGSTAEIVARITKNPVVPVDEKHPDPDIPPISTIKGIDLVTEGVITLNRVVEILQQYVENNELGEEFYYELDKGNGATMIASRLIEHCTDLDFIIGQAINPAYQDAHLSFDLAARKHLCRRIKELMRQMGKKVTMIYY